MVRSGHRLSRLNRGSSKSLSFFIRHLLAISLCQRARKWNEKARWGKVDYEWDSKWLEVSRPYRNPDFMREAELIRRVAQHYPKINA
jgi:hypothetical protein